MAESRTLIVNADDFGLSDGVNAGIVAAHEHGIVTSTTLMVRRPAARAAAAYAAGHPRLAVGLHLDFGQWEYEGGEWVTAYESCSLEDGDAVAAEARAQLDAFGKLLGRAPTHVDSHQHVHMNAPAAAAVREVVDPLGVPLRAHGIRYLGDFYGQTGRGEPLPEAITAERLVELIAGLPGGVTEMGCHPGIAVTGETSYRAERELEVAALCDPRVRQSIEDEGIVLCSFAALR
jgi:chitin disaccharide deacetylase